MRNASDTQFLVASNNNLINNINFNNHVPTSVPNILHSNVISVVDVQEQQQQIPLDNRNNICLLCRKHFMDNLARLYRQDNIESNNLRRATNSSQIIKSSNSSCNVVRSPISIHVIDAENLSVCMCSLYNSRNNSDDNLLRAKDSGSPNLLGHLLNNATQQTDETNNICPICRNIIKKQPIERRTLISKRLLLANDIIVNRIDSHYLNTFSGINLKQDPYTPESPDFDSPYLESDSSDTNRDNDSELRLQTDTDDTKSSSHETDTKNTNNLLNNSIRTSGGVSPTQLKSRLERLQQLSPECLEDETTNIVVTTPETKIESKMNNKLHDEHHLTISDEITKNLCVKNKKGKNDAPCCTGKECCIL